MHSQDLDRIQSLKDQHFPKEWWHGVIVGVFALGLLGVTVWGMIQGMYWMICFHVFGMVTMVSFDFWRAARKSRRIPAFLAGLQQLNEMFRSLSRPFQVYSRNGSEFLVERLHDEVLSFPLLGVDGDVSGLCVFSTQFSLTVEAWCGRHFAEHDFPLEVEQLNRVLRERKFSSVLWILAPIGSMMFILIGTGFTVVYFELPPLWTILVGLVLSLAGYFSVTYFIRRAALDNREDLRRAFDDLSMRHCDEKTWEWFLWDAREHSSCALKTVLLIFEVVLPFMIAAPLIGIRKKMEDGEDRSADAESTTLFLRTVVPVLI
jgi:hypothetical protein